MHRLKRLWELTNPQQEEEIPPPFDILDVSLGETIFIFPCPDCQQNVEMEKINPGEAAVLKCPNCDISLTVYNPSLVIRRTKEIPEEIQDRVWGSLANEGDED